MQQYGKTPISKATLGNIDLLKHENTFTVTTGHQLNLFTGPLYFLYKIISVLNLTDQLNATYPDQHFVPIYWMATEDHDFAEINYFNFKGKKIEWSHDASGAVGDLPTDGLDVVYQILKEHFGTHRDAQTLLTFFSEAYLHHDHLADATRHLANTLFQSYGLVILDGNNTELKRLFAPIVEKELTEQLGHRKITETTARLLENGYDEQVHPREINLFYLKEGLRERLIEKEGVFYVDGTSLSFTREKLLDELHTHPERFSPNALLRPVYQEIILPNIGYVGGGGELAYWFQLKDYFEAISVPFPILLLRNSAVLVPNKISEKLETLKVSVEDCFMSQHELRSNFTRQHSEIDIDFTPQRKHLRQQFADLYGIAEQTDASFVGAVAAQEKKQLNGLDHLEKRLLKAQKRKLSKQLDRLGALQDALFPAQSLQERNMNFSEFYLTHGERLIPKLKEGLDPLDLRFTIISLD